MNVLELFRRLSLGELSNLAMGNDGAGTIKDADKPKIVLRVNDGLKDLFTRFILREENLILLMQEGVSTYEIKHENCFSKAQETGNPAPYIMDSIDAPYDGRYIKPLEIYDSYGQEYSIGLNGGVFSASIPQAKKIHINRPIAGMALGVTYQALHPRVDTTDETTQQIDIPEVLESALTTFVAAEIFNSISGAENAAKGQSLMLRYEGMCQQVEGLDLVSTSRIHQSNKFNDRGFV